MQYCNHTYTSGIKKAHIIKHRDYPSICLKHLLFPGWRQSHHQGIPETPLFWTVWWCVCPSPRHPSASPETPAAADATQTSKTSFMAYTQTLTVIQRGAISLNGISEERRVRPCANKAHRYNKGYFGPMKNTNIIQFLDYQSLGRLDRGQAGTADKQTGEWDVTTEAVDGMQKQSRAGSVIAGSLFSPAFPLANNLISSGGEPARSLTSSNQVMLALRAIVSLKRCCIL